MKTISVRITAEQGRRLQEIATKVPGMSKNGMAQRALDLWLDTEGPVYLAAFREAQRKLSKERQDVVAHLSQGT